MVEMLGVLAIIGVLTIGAMSSVNYGIEAFRVRSAFDLVEETARGVADLYSWKRSYLDGEDVNASRAPMKGKICKNIFENKCVTTGEGANNAAVETNWGLLVVEPSRADQFTMKLTGVPASACNQLLNMEWTNVTLTTSSCGEGVTDIEFTSY